MVFNLVSKCLVVFACKIAIVCKIVITDYQNGSAFADKITGSFVICFEITSIVGFMLGQFLRNFCLVPTFF